MARLDRCLECDVPRDGARLRCKKHHETLISGVVQRNHANQHRRIWRKPKQGAPPGSA